MEYLGQNSLILEKINTASVKYVRTIQKLVFREYDNIKNLGDLTYTSSEIYSEEYENKFKQIRRNYNSREITLACDILGLNCNGIVEEVAKRICDFLCDINIHEMGSEDIFDDEEDFEAVEDIEVIEYQKESHQPAKSTDCYSQQKTEAQFLKCVNHFRDIKDFIRVFSGNEDISVECWIEEFEETSKLMGWDDFCKFIYAKKSLKGVAKIFIQVEKGVKTWEVLKDKLLEEFSRKMSSADLHSILRRRKMKRAESVQEYFLVMKEIGRRGNIDTDSLIQYIINGINDDPTNKIILYGAQNLTEFKIKLRYYEKMKDSYYNESIHAETLRQKNRFVRYDGSYRRFTNDDLYKERCFNCGSMGHISNDCSHRAKGMKCFKCNDFGHKAVDCQAGQKSLFHIRNKLCSKQIKINNVTLTALIDTGSFVNIINNDIYRKIGSPSLHYTEISLLGFGGGSVQPTGYFNTVVNIDLENFPTKVYVTPQIVYSVDAIIGQDLLKQAEIEIKKNVVHITKTKEHIPDVVYLNTEYIYCNLNEDKTPASMDIIVPKDYHKKPKLIDITRLNELNQFLGTQNVEKIDNTMKTLTNILNNIANKIADIVLVLEENTNEQITTIEQTKIYKNRNRCAKIEDKNIAVLKTTEQVKYTELFKRDKWMNYKNEENRDVNSDKYKKRKKNTCEKYIQKFEERVAMMKHSH